ncbi:replication initiation protein [Hymenobacter profundi]|uniref:Replication initiation protein n=1 Tax=Hymenobacter profundi TaxID=1982110 RepID=A0ABS6WVS5_9BACT|nr:replication initiation protein [Hymenobacter profundi]MBW3127713.1 replication initiation protein [Hymenobacter profundi]
MQTVLFDSTPSEEPSGKIVVQHNALVNARFDLSTVEMRLFMAMLSRIGRDDSEFREMCIPLTEIVALSGRRPSSKDYQQVASMCDQLVSRILHIERPTLTQRKERRNAPDFDKIPLMAYAKYRGEEGALRVRFNDEVMPYLLQLHRNFTKAQVVQLLKLKSPHSYRIYWLLKEYSTFGNRVMSVEELKGLLNLDGQYKQFPLFRLRVLDKAQIELSQTDLPFEYELIRQGKSVFQIRFIFKQMPLLVEPLPPALAGWQEVLHQVGLAPSSLATIVSLVEQGAIEPEYVVFVVKAQREKHRLGKVKSLAGSVFTAITKRHLVTEYQQAQERHKVRQVAVVEKVDAVRFQVSDLEPVYQTLVKKNKTADATFEEHLQRVYLSQGFVLRKDQEGKSWVIKQ